MRMRIRTITLATLTLLWIAATAHAGDYYKWTDAHGTVHYSQTPPPGQAAKTVYVNDGAPVAPPPGMDYQKPTAQQNAQARVNQTALQRVDVQAAESNCVAARQNITRLENRGKRALARSDSTDVRALTPEQRDQALADARAAVARYCSRKR